MSKLWLMDLRKPMTEQAKASQPKKKRKKSLSQ
jgi:hypothetical protein